jgi:5S rRNA maturation endonuclease (ribonuclease M5)
VPSRQSINSRPVFESDGSGSISTARRRTGSETVIVVKGYFDCLRVHQAGFPCVVAWMGSSLSAEQERILIERFERVVLMLDGDATGRTASRVISAKLTARCRVVVVHLPHAAQPDQLSPAAIEKLLLNVNTRKMFETRIMRPAETITYSGRKMVLTLGSTLFGEPLELCGQPYVYAADWYELKAEQEARGLKGGDDVRCAGFVLDQLDIPNSYAYADYTDRGWEVFWT